MHTESHPLAGKSVKLNDNAVDPLRGILVPGAVFELEDWYDVLTGKSWMSDATFTTMHYGQKINWLERGTPDDLGNDEVVYGHVDGLGHIVHVSELGEEVGSWR